MHLQRFRSPPSVLQATFSFIHLGLFLVLTSLQLGQDFVLIAHV
jgi:hypothetical protein